MSNGYKPTPKTIDEYLKQFEDETLMSQEDIQQTGEQQNIPQTPVDLSPDQAGALLTQFTTEAIDATPRIAANPELSVEPNLLENNLQSDRRNWWNTFYQQIDQIQLSKYKGKRLFAQREINDIDEQIERLSIQLQTDLELSNEERADIEKNIISLNKQKQDLEEDIQDYAKDIQHNEDQIANEPISKFYQEKTQKDQETEGNSLWEWLNSGESAQDIGGSLSEAAVIGASLLPNIFQSLASTFATTSGGNVHPAIAIGSFVTGLGVGVGATIYQRDAESNAEAWDAYETRVANDIANYQALNPGPIPPEIVKKIEENAMDGVSEVYDKNMNLLLGDAAQIGVGVFAPWGKLTTSVLGHKKVVDVLGRGLPLAHTGGRYGAMGVTQAALEGREEGDQYLIKQDYLQGVYDKGQEGYNEGMLAGLNRSLHIGLETSKAMGGMLMGDHMGGRTNNPEFRNSVRAGALVGVGMGATMQGINDVFGRGLPAGVDAYRARKGQQMLLNDLADQLQKKYTVDVVYDMLENKEKAANVKSLVASLPDDIFLDNKTKEGAIQEVNHLISLYDKLQKPEYDNLNTTQKKAAIVTMLRAKDVANNATKIKEENQQLVNQAYNDTFNIIERPDGFTEINSNAHKLAGVKQQISDIKKALKSKKKAVNSEQTGQDRILSDVLQKLEKLQKAYTTQSKESKKTYPGVTPEINDNIVNLEGIIAQAEAEAELNNDYYKQMEKMGPEELQTFAPYVEQLDIIKEIIKKQKREEKEAKENENSVKSPDQAEFKKGDKLSYKGNIVTYIDLNPDGTYKVKLKDNTIANLNAEDVIKKEPVNIVQDKLREVKHIIETDQIKIDGAITEDILKDATVHDVLNSKEDLIDPNNSKEGIIVMHDSHIEASNKGQDPASLENTNDDKVKHNDIHESKKKEDSRPRLVYLVKDRETGEYLPKGSRGTISEYENFIKFIEKTKESDLMNKYEIEYTINDKLFDKEWWKNNLIEAMPKDLPEEGKNLKANDIISLFKNPKNINESTAKELGYTLKSLKDLFKRSLLNLPIKVSIIDKKTQQNVDEKMFGVLYDRADNTTTRKNLYDQKLSIYNTLAEQERAIGKIAEIYNYQDIKNIEEQNDPREVFGDTLNLFGIGNSNIQGISISKNNDKLLSDYFEFQDSHNGLIFAKILRGDGNTSSVVKVNNKNLSEREANIILDIYLDRIKNPKKGLKSAYQDTGLTQGQMLNLLVYEGKNINTVDSNRRLSVDPQTKTITFGPNKIKGLNISKEDKQKFLDHVTKHKKRRVNLEQLNESIFSGELSALEEIRFLGEKITKGKNDNYNDILMDQGVLTVNIAITENQNPFERPNIMLSPLSKRKSDKPHMGQQSFGNFSEVTPESLIGPRVNEKEAKAYWRKNAPNFPMEFVDEYIEMGKEKGALAQGIFQVTGVKLSRKAAPNVEKHELYHVIEELMLTNEERAALNAETKEVFGEVSNEEINKQRERHPITAEQANLLGFDSRFDFWEHKVLAEQRANKYEVYAESDGKTEFTPKETSFFKKLWNWIKNIFSKPQITVDGLFNKIHQGYYKGEQPRTERMKALFDAGFVSYSEVMDKMFTAPEIRHITSTLLFSIVERSGGIKQYLEEDTITLDINEGFNGLREYIETLEEGTLKSYNERILENEEFFRSKLQDRLAFLKAEETLIEDEDIREVEEEGNMEILTATRPVYEISNRNKIRPSIRLLVLMTPKLKSTQKTAEGWNIVKNQFTGLAELEDEKLFNIIEDELADIVDGNLPKYDEQGDEIPGEYIYTFASDQMLERLEKLQEVHPSIAYILKVVNSIETLPEKLHSSFNNRSIKFVNLNYKGSEGNRAYNLVDSSSFKKRENVITEWFENFKDLNLVTVKDDVITGNKNAIIPILKEWKKSYKQKPTLLQRFTQADEVLTDEIANDILGHLSKIGIDLNISDLKQAMSDTRIVKTTKKPRPRFGKLLSQINRLFVAPKGYSLKNMSEGVEIDFDKKNVIKDESIVDNLALVKSRFLKSPGESTITTAKGRSHWTYGSFNNMTQVVQMIKNSTDHINKLLKSPYNTLSPLLSYLKTSEGRNAIEVLTFGAMRGYNQVGTQFKNMKATDEHAARYALQLAHNITIPMTYASKPVWQLLKGLPKRVELGGTAFKWDKDGISMPNGVFTPFAEKIISEYNRILQVQEHIDGGLTEDEMIVDMHYSIDEEGNRDYKLAQGLEFINFPGIESETELFNSLFKNDGKPFTNLDPAIINKLYPYIEKILKTKLEEALEKALETGIITRKEDSLVNNALDKKTLMQYQNKYGDSIDSSIRRAIADYTLNGMINNMDMLNLFLGDPAFYSKIEKRTPSLLATGTGLSKIVDENGNAKTKYTVAFALDKIKLSEIHPQLGNIVTTDGNTFISPQHYKDLVTGLEGWNPEKEEAHQRLVKGIGRLNDIELLVTQPLKGMHFELRHYMDMSIPTYLKYSQVPLYKTLTEGTQLDNIRMAMDNTDKPIDAIVFMSAAKAGAQAPINLFDSEGNIKPPTQINKEAVPVILQLRHWKQQQVAPVKSGSQGLIATQVRKVVQGGLDQNTEKGRRIAKELNELDSATSNIQIDNYKEKYNIELNEDGYTIKDKQKYFEDIKKSITRNTSIPTHIKEDFNNDLAVSPMRRKIQQIMASQITKPATKLKGAGGGHILISGGFFTNIIKTSDLSKEERIELLKSSIVNEGDLRPSYIDETGKVVKGHIWITMPEAWRKAIPNAGKLSMNELKKYLTSEKMRTVIGYRIPTQFLSSLDGHELAGILPATYGNAVIAYDELIPKTGHDFDFDKWYLLLPELGYNKENDHLYYIKYDTSKPASEQSIKAIHNRRIELYSELLEDPDVHKQSMTPIETLRTRTTAAIIRYKKNRDKFSKSEQSKLKVLRKANKEKEYIALVNGKLDQKSDLQWASPDNQMDDKRFFNIGRHGLGQWARHSSDHGISSYSPIATEYIGVGQVTEAGAFYTRRRYSSDLSQMYNQDGQMIYNILSSYLNINVDIEGDIETLKGLNLVPATNNHRALMIRSGAPDRWTDFLLAQDIIVDLTSTMDNNEGSLSIKQYDDEGLVTAQKAIMKKWATLSGLSINDEGDLFNKEGGYIEPLIKKTNLNKTKGITESALETMFEGSDSTPLYYQAQLQILQYFGDLTKQAKSLNNLIDASTADTSGVGGSIAKAQNLLERIKLAKNDENLKGVAERFNNTALATYTENAPKLYIELMREFFPDSGPAFTTALSRFRIDANRDILDSDTVNLIKDHLYAAIYMKIDGTKKADLKEMFYGENSVANKLWDMKYGPNRIKDNALIDFLLPIKARNENELGYIKANYNSLKTPEQIDDIVLAWKDLKGELFTKLLPKYALYSTGWRTNLFSFHELVPTEYKSNIVEGFKKLKNPRRGESGLEDFNFFDKIYDQVYRHLHHNKTLVPNARKNDLVKKSLKRIGNTRKGSVISFQTDKNKFKITDEEFSRYRPFITYEDRVTGETNLYEYVGNDEKNTDIAIYNLTNKMGLRDDQNRYLYEYSFSQEGTFIEENKIADITKEVSKGVDVIAEDKKKITDTNVTEEGVIEFPESGPKTKIKCP